MLDTQRIYSSILIRGRRSNPTFDQVREEARVADRLRFEADLYR